MKIIDTIHFGIQRKMIANMTSKSWKQIPHVSYTYEPDITDFFNEYKRINKDKKIVTFNTLMLKVIVEGIKKAPIINSHIYFNERLVRGHIDIFENIDFSIPMMMPNGDMMSITLYGFENKSLSEMSEYVSDVKQRIENTDLNQFMYDVSFSYTMNELKKGKILSAVSKLIGSKTGAHRVKSLHGKAKEEYLKIPEFKRLNKKDGELGTITITNIGSIYPNMKGQMGLIEIIPPQVAVISIGAIQDRAIPSMDLNGEMKIMIRKVLPLCIAFDHRAFDFNGIIPFCERIDEIFNNPVEIREWLI